MLNWPDTCAESNGSSLLTVGANVGERVGVRVGESVGESCVAIGQRGV